MTTSHSSVPHGQLPPQPGMHKIALTLNGSRREIAVAPWTTLLDLLREELQLTGTKKG